MAKIINDIKLIFDESDIDGNRRLTGMSGDKYKITKITIPDGVTEIGKGVFMHCESLEEITIPDSVTEIGSSAFMYCTSLKEIKIPDSVIDIGEYAFAGCESLQKISISDGVIKNK